MINLGQKWPFSFDILSKLLNVHGKNGDNIFPFPGNAKNTFILFKGWLSVVIIISLTFGSLWNDFHNSAWLIRVKNDLSYSLQKINMQNQQESQSVTLVPH